MKILYITANPLEYSSSANMRNIALISGLQKLGHEVDSLSAEYNNKSIYSDKIDLKFNNRYWIKLGTIQSNISNNIKYNNLIKMKLKNLLYKVYIRLSIYDPKKNLINYIDSSIVDKKYDLIISSSDPKSSHLIAEKIIKLNPEITKKWIQYWGDPFSSDINNKKIIPNKMVKKEEKRLISLCDKVIYVSPFTLQEQKRIYSDYKEKMEFLPIPYYKKKIYKETKNERIKIGYFGDYYLKNRNIIPLYETIKEEKDKELIICGNSDLDLKEYTNIKIMKRQSSEKIKIIEENIDILVCVCNSSGTQIPGKIYHYAATNKPILIIVDGEYSNDLIEYFTKFNRFILCENNGDKILEAINKIVQQEYKYKPLEEINARNISEKLLRYVEK